MADRVLVTAPVRVLDAGGWTDTWFAGAGLVCHLAVEPGVEIDIRSRPARAGGATVDLDVRSFAERYRFRGGDRPGRHPLLEAVLARWAPTDASLEVTVAASVPPGSGLGTSASVGVALIAGLVALSGQAMDADALATAAHAVETGDLGWQSGVQDQLAAAHGGANLVTVGPYPRTRTRPLHVSDATWEQLARRLVHVYLGQPHRSSLLHDAVIERMAGADREVLLEPLRSAARRAADALVAGDLDGYGRAMTDNTRAQASLHPGLVGPGALEVIALARSERAAGWKVNGAGGDGGSVTIVGPDDPSRLVEAFLATPGLVVLPLEPARRGATVVPRP